MSLNTLVSVIIPSYNSEAFVSCAINSALNQTHKNIEIVLVDNNSTDNTLEVLHNFQSRYPEKISVLQELKQGAPAARNKGLYAAKGEWIQFLDSDDELFPNKINYQIDLAANKCCDLIIGNYISRGPWITKKTSSVKDPWVGLISRKLGNTCSNLWRKSILLQAGGWNEDMPSSQEYMLLFNLLKLNPKICFDKSYNTVINYHVDSVSQTQNQEKKHQLLTTSFNLRLKIKDYLLQNNMLNKQLSKTLDVYFYKRLIISKHSCNVFYVENANRFSKQIPLLVKNKILINQKTKMAFQWLMKETNPV